MKEEALELADFLEKNMVASIAILGDVTAEHIITTIRRLVEELDWQGEPVAWFDGKYLVCPELGYEYTITTEHPKTLGWKPLYTAPQTKPLSDEEILEVAKKKGWSGDLGFLVNFARAIEERILNK